MTIEKGHLVAGFLDGLSLLRMWLKKKLLQRLDQRDIEPVEPDDGFSRVVCVVVPGQLRRQNKIAFLHYALLTINRRIGSVPFENEAQSGRCVGAAGRVLPLSRTETKIEWCGWWPAAP